MHWLWVMNKKRTKRAARLGAMSGFALLLASLVLLAACGVSVSTTPNGVQVSATAPTLAPPHISGVYGGSTPGEWIISGSGFGTYAPFNGTSPYIEVNDNTQGWSAGYSVRGDTLRVAVSKWVNDEIDLTVENGTGFLYPMDAGDSIAINVWNPQSQNEMSYSFNVGQ